MPLQIQLHRPALVLGLIAWLGIAQFVYGVAQAIDAYDGYSLEQNFLSDLGRTINFTGQDNSGAASVFNRSVILLGLTLIPFFAVVPSVVERWQQLLRTLGVLSACGLIAIGLTPYDQYLFEHLAALALWLVPMFLFVVVFLWQAPWRDTRYVVLLVATLVVLWAMYSYVFASEHVGHVVYQKVLAGCAIVWFALVFLGVSVATVRAVTSRRMLVERQARKYLSIIEQGHRRKR